MKKLGFILPFLTIFAFTSVALAQSSAMSDSAAVGGVFLLITGLFYCLIGVFILFGMVIGIASFVIWIYMMIDVFMRDFGEDGNMAVIWFLVLFVAGMPIGGILYYVLVMQKYPLKK